MVDASQNMIYKYKSAFLEELGVRSWINARNWSSNIGGNYLDERVLAVMNEVSQTFVDMPELVQKADERIAHLCNAEEAHVTTGAGGAIELAVAGCMSRDDFGKWDQLPDTSEMQNEVVIHRGHYINYTSQWKATGAKLVEYGISGILKSSKKELRSAITQRTCCIAYTFSYNNVPRGIVPFDEIVEIANELNIPVIVDAASELPPIENLWKFLDMGADIVCMSGGKAIKGPNNMGFMIGRKKGAEIIKSIRTHSFPAYGWDRGHKMSKEQIVGLVKALEIFKNEGDEVYGSQLKIANYIHDQLKNLVDVKVLIIKNEPSSHEHVMMPHVPRVLLEWDGHKLGKKAEALDEWMAKHDPPVFLRNVHYHNYYSNVEWRMVDTFFLRSSEEQIVVNRILEFFNSN